jgi:hypothetical protein
VSTLINRAIATALPIGLIAFTLLVLQVTTAEAGDCVDRVDHCKAGESEVDRNSTGWVGGERVTCCTTPSEPYATGESEAERAARFEKEAATIKANCEAQGQRYDPATASCKRPIKIGKSKAAADCEAQGQRYDYATRSCYAKKQMGKKSSTCEAKGLNYRYDPDTGQCIHTTRMGKKGSPEPDEACEARGRRYHYDWDTGQCVKSGGMKRSGPLEQADGDYRPKKKRHYEDEWQGGGPLFETISPFFRGGGPFD